MFEAMGMSIPILMGVKGEAGEIVKRAKAGWLIEPDNSEDLVNKVSELLNSPEKMQEMKNNGRNFVKKYFNREDLAKDYLKILESVQ
jgi:glycosyltransferase involved in cell wall biosynthesis